MLLSDCKNVDTVVSAISYVVIPDNTRLYENAPVASLLTNTIPVIPDIPKTALFCSEPVGKTLGAENTRSFPDICNVIPIPENTELIQSYLD